MYKQVLIPALVLSSMALTVPALAEQIYRWVDGSGQVHYSDVPRDGAEQIDVDPAQTFSSPVTARASSSPVAEQTAAEPAAVYAALDIVSPTQEETIWNTGGVITVSVSPSPALKLGHSLRIYYDGKQINESSPTATSVQVSEVYRGQHQISADILDINGIVLQQAAPVTFFYKQSTVSN
jgi:hypothetical protein